jgi:hypothetical protein
MPDTDAAYGPSMRPKLVAAVLVAIILSSCSLSSSPSSSSQSAKDLVALEGAWARLNSVRMALNAYSRAVRLLFNEMEDPYGPEGKSAVTRASQALNVASRRAAVAKLPETLEAEEQRMKESTEAMLAAWRRFVPKLKSILAEHQKLLWEDGMDRVEEAQNALDQSLASALYEVSLLSCEASGGYWDSELGGCMEG